MLQAFSVTDIGKRRQLNQDYVFAQETPLGNLANLFLVADGMGGHMPVIMHRDMQWKPLYGK